MHHAEALESPRCVFIANFRMSSVFGSWQIHTKYARTLGAVLELGSLVHGSSYSLCCRYVSAQRMVFHDPHVVFSVLHSPRPSERGMLSPLDSLASLTLNGGERAADGAGRYERSQRRGECGVVVHVLVSLGLVYGHL
jgi:hypothetical protein